VQRRWYQTILDEACEASSTKVYPWLPQ